MKHPLWPLCLSASSIVLLSASDLPAPLNTWVKRSPLPDGPPSPRLGYEGACVWDTEHHLLIRYGGHNQGGGGAQYSEVWTFDLRSARWKLLLPNTSPPGVCCAQQNVFEPLTGRYVRFPAFSGNHGWQAFREIYLNNGTVWLYDLDSNRWVNRAPVPTPRVSPLRCAAWDEDAQVIVLFGGEGNHEGTCVYDPYANTWTWMKPPREPPFRSAGNMTYDARRKRHILFGAQFSNDPHTWAYNLRQNRWIDLKPDRLPPTNRNDAVLTYDRRSDMVVCIVHLEGKHGKGERLQTWGYECASNRWRQLMPKPEPDPSGNRARVLCYAPEYGLVVLENRTRAKPGPPEQQIWTYRYRPGSPPEELPAPTGLSVHATGAGARLAWNKVTDPRVTGYVVLRGTGEKSWQVRFSEIAALGAEKTSFEEKGLRKGTLYWYAVRCRAGETLGPRSAFVRTQPPVIEDLFCSVLSEKEVQLTWRPPRGARNIAGYVVERAACAVWSDEQLRKIRRGQPPPGEVAVGAIKAMGPFKAVCDLPASTLTYKDTVDLRARVSLTGKPIYQAPIYKSNIHPEGRPYRYAVYAYRVRARNALGVLSGPSPFALTIPSMPQWVFSREEGTACQLKWQANPEKHLRGYFVYRLNGRWNTDTIARLTPTPIQETRFTDGAAGSRTRRYYIVAADALGQEGLLSAPVWYRREWERFYRPFVGPWHQ